MYTIHNNILFRETFSYFLHNFEIGMELGFKVEGGKYNFL